VALILGLVAVLSLSGPVSHLPPWLAFFLTALSITLFPGILIWSLSGGDDVGFQTIGEKLAVWFAAGVGVLSLAGFAGIVLGARLSHLMAVLAVLNVGAIVLIVAGRMRFSPASGIDAEPEPHGRLLMIVLLAIAVGVGLTTTVTPRDGDDWYYTAHIADYAGGTPIASEDAFFGEAGPVVGRSWFGGWWVAEAILARASGLDAVDCHQVYLPLLLVPFGVLAVFALAMQLFRSIGLALAACCFQILYYLSSAFPHQSAGWMLFCRAAQDKSVSALIMVPVAVTLALGLMRRASEKAPSGQRRPISLLLVVTVASTLVHPQGVVWVGLALLPFAVMEVLRLRTRRSLRAVGLILLSLAVSGIFLLSGRETLEDAVQVLQARNTEGKEIPSVASVYLPGENLFTPEAAPVGYVPEEVYQADTGNPLRVARYPLAVLGLALVVVVLTRVHKSFTARFLAVITLSVLYLVFTPQGAAMSARVMTFRTLYRLTWLLPWGFVIAFALSSLKLPQRWVWVLFLGIGLVLARGNPANYVRSLAAERGHMRPSAGAAEMLRILRTEPAPQGRVLADEETGRFVAGFAPEAYPPSYRGEGALDATELDRILNLYQPDEAGLQLIQAERFRYMLLERNLPLAGMLMRGWTNCKLIAENEAYRLWAIPDSLERGKPRHPGPNILLITVDSMRRDHLGCYGYAKPTSPNMDGLAREGTRFGNAVCQSPQTAPSLVSLHTGLNPRTHGVLNHADVLADRFLTLAEVLSGKGYLTSAFTSGYALDSCGLDQGFDLYWRVYDHFTLSQTHARYQRQEDPTTDALLAWLDRHSESPLFTWVHWLHPRRPYAPPPEQEAVFLHPPGAGGDLGLPPRSSINGNEARLSGEEIEALIGRYDGEVAFADVQVGRVLKRLEELGLRSQTVVVLTADHGEALHDHEDYFGHDRVLYDETVMVPLIIQGDTVSIPASSADSLARTIDVMPTLLGLVDVEIQDMVEGEDLLSLPEGSGRWKVEYAFSETFPFVSDALPRHAVRTKDSKIIWKDAGQDSIKKEFYDLGEDPDELNDLFRAQPAEAARLDSVLSCWIGPDTRHPVHVPDPPNSRMCRLLRRLGYID
jgi:arylsulfatase A-like enzyme